MKVIECSDLHVAYEKQYTGTAYEVLKGVSFAIEEGSRTAIIGPNGSGKSTLIKAVCGMLPYRGSVRICGTDLDKMNRRTIARNIAYMTQLSEVFFSYTVYETVLMGRYVHAARSFGRASQEDIDAVMRAMRSTGVEVLKDRQLSSLSGGELQRVFLARTFAQDSPILILDEPNNHLDLKVVSELAGYLKNWSENKPCLSPADEVENVKSHTLIGVYHDITLAMELADFLILMEDGRIAAQGSKEEILKTDALENVYGFAVRDYLKTSLERVVNGDGSE
ncbi:MAG: ABC transporter ATP-binding protein [Lachnospiraceae bacterium]|nr:ABC transporter ATP-binding protein [Lachnospiraceae bacterium]